MEGRLCRLIGREKLNEGRGGLLAIDCIDFNDGDRGKIKFCSCGGGLSLSIDMELELLAIDKCDSSLRLGVYWRRVDAGDWCEDVNDGTINDWVVEKFEGVEELKSASLANGSGGLLLYPFDTGSANGVASKSSGDADLCIVQ